MNSNVKMLNDEALMTAIEKYVDEHLYDYAVMIDGAWGCGKTYFATHVLKPKLIEHEERRERDKDNKNYKKRNVIYVSLYGIKAIEDISKQLYMEAYLGKDNKNGKLLKKGASIVSSMAPIAFDIVKSFIKNVEVEKDDIANALSKFLSIKDSILIFDDLERCECPVNEILGYINSFVEHENMKVILIANQLEIGRTNDQRKELQYLVAAGEDEIDFLGDLNSQGVQIHKQCKNTNEKDEKKREPISVEQLEARADILFGKDREYERIREKLVGTTFYYSPDLEKVLRELLCEASINTDLKKLLEENVDFFIQYMEKQNCRNLRTFLFYLSKIGELYQAIIGIEKQVPAEFINYIIEYCFEACVNYKAGTLIYEWEGIQEYGNGHLSKTGVFETILRFRFVDDFVINSVLDSKRIERMLRAYEEMLEEQKEYSSPFRQLESTWYILEDEELEKQLKECLQELSKNKYKIREYVRIIPFLLQLEKVGFSEEYLAQALESMKVSLSQLKKYARLDDSYCPSEDKEINRRTGEILKELNYLVDEKFKESVKDTMGGFLNIGDGWADNLLEYIKQNKYDIHISGGFLLQLNINMLISKVISSTPKDIYAFRLCVLHVYDDHFIHGVMDYEKEEVKKLLFGIKECNRDGYGRIKRMQLNMLIETLQNTVTEYMGDTLEEKKDNK